MIDLMLSFSNNLISDGIACLLSTEEAIRIHTVRTPSELVHTIQERQPDVVLLDYITLFKYIPQGFSGKTKVLLFDAGCSEEEINYALISKNISGLVTNKTDVGLLIKAIRSVSSGHLWIDAKSTRNLIAILSRLIKLCNLTKRQQEILCMLGRGMDDSLISEALKINKKTVKSHIDKAGEKIGAHDRCDLARLSMQFSDYTTSNN